LGHCKSVRYTVIMHNNTLLPYPVRVTSTLRVHSFLSSLSLYLLSIISNTCDLLDKQSSLAPLLSIMQ
jgi:hypothetical protein